MLAPHPDSLYAQGDVAAQFIRAAIQEALDPASVLPGISHYCCLRHAMIPQVRPAHETPRLPQDVLESLRALDSLRIAAIHLTAVQQLPEPENKKQSPEERALRLFIGSNLSEAGLERAPEMEKARAVLGYPDFASAAVSPVVALPRAALVELIGTAQAAIPHHRERLRHYLASAP